MKIRLTKYKLSLHLIISYILNMCLSFFEENHMYYLIVKTLKILNW